MEVDEWFRSESELDGRKSDDSEGRVRQLGIQMHNKVI